jgi:hypothetical protein
MRVPAAFSLWVSILVSIPVLVPYSATASEKLIFVTSISGTGELGAWPEAGGATGLAAADAICQNQAADAGLPAPLTFIAWISDSSNDAYCRAHGLTGKKTDSCGESSLPTWAGPWIRTDGVQMGETIEHLIWPEGQTSVPIDLDERGNPVPYNSELYFTNTDIEGAFRNQSNGCADWTNSAQIAVRAGSANATSVWWTDALSTFCDRPHGLLCLQPGAGDSVAASATYGARTFATSVTGAGNLGAWPEASGQAGVAAGDAICQNLAAAAGLGLPWSYVAWLSTSSEDAIDRFTFNGPWIRSDGVTVAVDKADLIDGRLLTSVNITEWGAYLSGRGAWTGTTEVGGLASDTCDDWTDASESNDGVTGVVNLVDEWWTNRTERPCDSTNYHLYCFSQVPFLFADGLELGDTSRWNHTVP